MRALSQQQATNCEHATKPRCRCRCGGTLHGAGRIGADRAVLDYSLLPPDDPHYAEPPKPSGRRQFPLFVEGA